MMSFGQFLDKKLEHTIDKLCFLITLGVLVEAMSQLAAQIEALRYLWLGMCRYVALRNRVAHAYCSSADETMKNNHKSVNFRMFSMLLDVSRGTRSFFMILLTVSSLI